MSKFSNRLIKSNLIQQNCFLRDASCADDLKSVCTDRSFESLDESSSDKGVSFDYNSYPYPITPAFVDSFVDSSDYRRDPVNAISNGVKRVNLGDIVDMQKISSLDSSEARALYEALKAKFSSSSVDVVSGDNVTGQTGQVTGQTGQTGVGNS